MIFVKASNFQDVGFDTKASNPSGALEPAELEKLKKTPY